MWVQGTQKKLDNAGLSRNKLENYRSRTRCGRHKHRAAACPHATISDPRHDWEACLASHIAVSRGKATISPGPTDPNGAHTTSHTPRVCAHTPVTHARTSKAKPPGPPTPAWSPCPQSACHGRGCGRAPPRCPLLPPGSRRACRRRAARRCGPARGGLG